MRAFPIVLIGALAISAPVVAHTEQLTLTGAIAEALRGNPELVALRRDYEAVQAAVPRRDFSTPRCSKRKSGAGR